MSVCLSHPHLAQRFLSRFIVTPFPGVIMLLRYGDATSVCSPPLYGWASCLFMRERRVPAPVRCRGGRQIVLCLFNAICRFTLVVFVLGRGEVVLNNTVILLLICFGS